MAGAVSPPNTNTLVEKILAESPIGMTAAAKLFGTFKQGKPVHPSTVTRWASEGVQIPGGRLRLEAVKIAGRLVTSRAAVVRFIQGQQEEPAAGQTTPAPRSPAERRRASDAAAQELDRIGIK